MSEKAYYQYPLDSPLSSDYQLKGTAIQAFTRALFSPSISSSTIARLSRTYGEHRIGQQRRDESNAEEQLPLSILDHISDRAAFGGTKEGELSSQTFYDISVNCHSVSSANLKGKARFVYTNNESHFSADIGVNSTLHHISGSELSGTLSICAAPLNALEGDTVLFRVHLLQTTNRACGEFNILILSFCRMPETGDIFHKVFTLEFRNRRWSLDYNLGAESGNSNGESSNTPKILHTSEAL